MGRVVLITGGCGFIGVNFVRYWREKYPEDFIINLDKLTYAGNRESQRELEAGEKYLFLQGDLADKKFVDGIFDQSIEGCPQPDLVVHFAAETHVDRSIKDPGPFVYSNIVGTYHLLEAAKNHGGVRFHHVSTDEVFGDLALDDPNKFHEESLYKPSSPYSASKAAADHFVRAYHRTYHLPITISNCANNYGPYMYPEKLIPLSITNLMQNKKITLYGDGLNIREWLYVKDHCEAIDLIIQKGEVGETYLVGGEEWTNRDVIDELLEQFEMGDDMVGYVPDRAGHDRKYAVDDSKLREELGWSSTVPFEMGLKGMIKWYKENEGWWKVSE